jgi:hypothetical protein
MSASYQSDQTLSPLSQTASSLPEPGWGPTSASPAVEFAQAGSGGIGGGICYAPQPRSLSFVDDGPALYPVRQTGMVVSPPVALGDAPIDAASMALSASVSHDAWAAAVASTVNVNHRPPPQQQQAYSYARSSVDGHTWDQISHGAAMLAVATGTPPGNGLYYGPG